MEITSDTIASVGLFVAVVSTIYNHFHAKNVILNSVSPYLAMRVRADESNSKYCLNVEIQNLHHEIAIDGFTIKPEFKLNAKGWYGQIKSMPINIEPIPYENVIEPGGKCELDLPTEYLMKYLENMGALVRSNEKVTVKHILTIGLELTLNYQAAVIYQHNCKRKSLYELTAIGEDQDKRGLFRTWKLVRLSMA